jgi:16S rRNA (guanine527-N7)-methyltransferase
MKGVQVDEKRLLGRSLKKMYIGFDESQVEDLIRYKDFLMEANRSVNLIGPADSSSIIKRHILDSLAPLSGLPGIVSDDKNNRILDIGSGGGLPGIPLAIMLKSSEMVLMEKSQKKSAFLSAIKNNLSLDNTAVLTGRAEELAHEVNLREKFSLVTARAVTKFNILLELSIPFCNINGKIIFYKSKKIFNEIEAAGKAVNILGGRIGELIEVDIPGLEEFRVLQVIDKERNTPKKFPRRFSQIKKKPLE